jgi:hypothetical protein
MPSLHRRIGLKSTMIGLRKELSRCLPGISAEERRAISDHVQRRTPIIAELERAPRDVYCGAIGWVDPAGPMRFSVAIRSPVMTQPGLLRLNVGGGITHDSRAGSEWEEALCKSAFLDLSPKS